ncbi:MFS transporter [Sinosporangium siamense]|uniref:Lysosomal dipeptide transporter MFSD1 n=1 Tax=Sinosporangium siamense TaxID=1367973 RepID=A0A919RDZ9_9ACTN|nr:MFS transporter [Sinosporangium siamense]GII92166.1 MFS transporter [Sinosporangium siamense]
MSTLWPPPEPRATGKAWLVWTLAAVFVVWLFSIQTGYGIVSPEIQATAGLTVAEVGLAATVYTWAFALCQFFSGALLDRFGSWPLMTIAVAFVTVGAFLYSATSSMAMLVLAQAVLALGSSFGFVGAGYLGGHWFGPARFGLMFGLVQSLSSLGSAAAQPSLSFALEGVSWQALLAGFGAFGILLVVLFALFVRNPGDPGTVRRAAAPNGEQARGLFTAILRDVGRCLANRQVLLAALVAGASFGTMIAVGSLWGPRLLEARGEGENVAAWLNAAAWVGLAAGAPLFAVLSERLRGRRVPATAGVLFQGLAVAGVIYLPGGAWGVSLVLMAAMGLFSGALMLGFTVAGESVPQAQLGTASAVVNGVCFLIGGLCTALPGRLLPGAPGLADYQRALWVIPALLMAGVVAALLLKESHPRRMSEPLASA